jgi:hypothetical protein
MRGRSHLEGLGVDGRIILKRSSRNRAGGVEWIDMVQDGEKLRDNANMIMDYRVQ